MSRQKWDVPSDNELRAEIQKADESSLEERVERLRFILEEFGPPADMLLVGGVPSMLAIQELQRSFIDGNFLVCILAAQIFVEHSLGGMYAMSGEDALVDSGFASLINAAEKDGAIDNTIAQRLHILRNMRNPYTHPKVGLHARGYMARLLNSKTYNPYELAEQDAREAIQIVVDYLRYGSPNWTPEAQKRAE
jgi:hypothetical protein